MTTRNPTSLPDRYDLVTTVPPEGTIGFGENHAFWIHDEATGLHINGHLLTCEDLGRFDLRTAKLSIMFPNGRTLFQREVGGGSSETEAVGANMRFTMIEPFKRWRCTFDGIMRDVTVALVYMSGAPIDHHRVPVRFEIEVETDTPAWLQGMFTEGGLGPVKPFIGGERYEQVFRATGRVVIGDQTIALTGFGNRTHRFGHRDLTASATAPRMLGHLWATALFPSGAAFGMHAFPTVDGGILWSEAFVLRNGEMQGAEIVRAPWLKNYWSRGEALEFVFRTSDGQLHEIAGETLGTVITGRLLAGTPGEQLSLFQGYARYNFAGETAINMIERSLRHGAIETGLGRPA